MLGREKKVRWFRLSLGTSLIIVACSLMTPYPAEFVRALRGEEENFFVDRNEVYTSEDKNEEDPFAIRPDSDAIDQEEKKSIVPAVPLDIDPDLSVVVDSPEASEKTLFKPVIVLPNYAKYTLDLPALPPIIPDGPSDDSVWDVNELSRGLNFKSEIKFTSGRSASIERCDKSNYQVQFTLNIVKPTPITNDADFAYVNPQLSKMFPSWNQWLSQAKVSGFYYQLMEYKTTELRKNLASLRKILTRHNFYDCDTILEILSPTTQRKALLIQADMDVVSDGTDGDRIPDMRSEIVNSDYYQPFTSYRWGKTTTRPNPLLKTWQKRLEQAKAKPASAERSRLVQSLEYGIADMKRNSYLVAEYDPFIVIPLGMINNSRSAFSPSPGDYAVVIVGNKLYPAIVGDAGPRYKIGEASLRLTKQISGMMRVNARPISDLSVTYLVFPKSAEVVKTAPCYDLWYERCSALIDEMGGLAPGYELFKWSNTIPPIVDPVVPEISVSKKLLADKKDVKLINKEISKSKSSDDISSSNNTRSLKSSAPKVATKTVLPTNSISSRKSVTKNSSASSTKTGKTKNKKLTK